MWHLHPGLPASCRSQAGVSRAALTSRKICAEIHSTGPGENKPSRASPGLGATLLVSLQGPTEHLLLPRLLILHPSPWLFLTNLLYHLASLNSFPAPGFHCCPRFLLSAPLELHPYCSSSPSFSLWLERPGAMLTWDTLLHHSSGKGPFSLWWRRDTPNDLCYQSPQVPFTSLSSRLTAKFTFPKPLSSFYRFFDSLRVFLCYSGAIQLMASQHCHYKPELFRCLLLSFKNWLYAEIWQTKCQPRRKFYFLPILYSKKKWPHFGLHKNAAFAASMTLVK